jgi:hypothetical protein
MFRRLVIEQIFFDSFSKLGMLGNGIRPHTLVILIDSRFVLGVFRIIQSPFSCFGRQFIRNRPLVYTDSAGDFCLRESSADEQVNLVAIASRKSFLFCFFMRRLYQKQYKNIKS